MRLSGFLQLAEIRLHEDTEIAGTRDPGSITGWNADVRYYIADCRRVDAPLLHHVLKIQFWSAAGTPADYLSVVEHRPVKLVELCSRNQVETVGSRKRAKDKRLVSRFPVVDVNSHLWARQRKIGFARKHQSPCTIAAVCRHEFNFKTLRRSKTFRQRDIHRNVEL